MWFTCLDILCISLNGTSIRWKNKLFPKMRYSTTLCFSQKPFWREIVCEWVIISRIEFFLSVYMLHFNCLCSIFFLFYIRNMPNSCFSCKCFILLRKFCFLFFSVLSHYKYLLYETSFSLLIDTV